MSAPCPLAVMDAIAHSVEQALVPGNDYRRELRAVQQALPEARAAVAKLVHYGHKIEQRRRGVLSGDADAEAQDWAAFRAALAKVGGAP